MHIDIENMSKLLNCLEESRQSYLSAVEYGRELPRDKILTFDEIVSTLRENLDSLKRGEEIYVLLDNLTYYETCAVFELVEIIDNETVVVRFRISPE
ncbi:hypothetical protein MFLO_04280 [Listeria floridensis FSL S10-1187]|uniref:Uncharacterized protein n=1 Tax=Listeria floridensis FSL S10-1187 TaxID=1265817 RepID=A0ABP3B1V1_9LIST|nr:hypothetical protein [Listeria floridensis]EUJ33129.1 hypothetical protein MFLO_04280 [Listeria floridensis FSL S10-1187]